MEEKAGNYKEYKNHFCLSETHLRKIHSILDDYSKKIGSDAYVSIYIGKENDSFYETQDLEKIFLDENSNGKEIKTLTMEIISNPETDEKPTNEKKIKNAAIIFTKDKETKAMIFTSYKSRDWCFLLIDELDGQVQRILKEKPISQTKAKIIDSAIVLGLLLVVAIGIAINLSNQSLDSADILHKSIETKIDFLVQQEIDRKNSKFHWSIPISIIVLFTFMSLLEAKPISRLAKSKNASVFYWGDAIVKYDKYIQKLNKLKWGVGIAFLVSSASSLIFYFLP